jgi:lambda family phage tail tape measure protein
VAYRADIEIGVRGADRLKELQERVTKLSRAIDDANVKTLIDRKAIQSVAEYSTVLGRASDNLREAVIQLTAAGKASGAYAEAISQYVTALGQANTAQATQNRLITEEIDLRRKAKLAAAGIRETTQYGGPIGPGPASPIDALVGQRSPVEERIRRTIDARQDELRLEQALLQLEEKSAAVANKELQARGEIARLAAQGVNAAAFRAAQTGTQVALPAFQERGLKLLDDSVRANESNRRIEQALNGERQRGVRFLEKQTAEEQRQVQLGLLGERTRNLAGTRGRTPAAPAGGFPVAGPLQSPGFQRTKGQVGKFGENLALGAGFPLLFGGGVGSVAGSALGSFVGPGFGGQILGGAIGQILDQAVQKAAQLGSALQLLDISKIEESGVRINANLETQISLIRQTGNAYAAQQAIQQEIFATTGALPGTVQGISDSVNVLSSAWSEFTAATSVTLGIIAAPFAAALGAAIRLVNLLLKGFNVVASGLAGLIQKTGEWVAELVAGGEALKNIQDFFSSLNPAIDEARAKYAAILGDLNGQVLLNREILELEKQKTTGNTAGGKDRNLDLTAQQKILSINAEIDNEIREINKDITEATKSQVDEAVRLLNVKRNQKIEEVQIETSIQRQRAAEEARDKAAREAARAAEEAARAAEQRFKALLSINKDYLSDQLKLIDLNVQQTELFKGTEAALQAQLDMTNKIGSIRVEILETEQDLALEEAKKLGTTAQVLQQYKLKFQILQAELNIQTKITEQSAAQAALQKQLRTNELQQSKQEAVRSLKVQQDKVSLDIAAFTQDPRAVEAARLNLDQITRAYETELSVQKEIDKLNTEIASTAFNEEQIANKQNELAIQQSKLDSLREELTLLDSLEQRQLKLKQFYADYGQLIQSVSGEIANAVTFGVAEMINGTKTAQEVFAQFLNSIANALLSAAQEMIAQYIAIGIARMFAGMGGGADPTAAGGDWISAVGRLSPNAKGNAFGANGIAPFARGGAFTNSVVGSPTMFKFAQGGAMRTGLMGEAGPEAIMPLQRGADGKLGVLASGGGGGDVNVVVNVDAKGSSVEGNDQGANQLGRVISAAVQSELIKQQRPGGILAR